jgi:phosphatidyl-myo-inositol alpha-mannosyltransferase
MKIGIVTEYYYPLLGGITEHVHNTKTEFEKMGHEVKVITSTCKGPSFAVHNKPTPSEADVIRIGRSVPIYSNGSFAQLTVGMRLREQMRHVLEAERFDLLHIHSPIVVTLPPLAILEARCPLVGTFHTYFDRSLIYHFLRESIQKGIDRLAGQVAVSRTCLEALGRYFNLRARIIPNGVDTRQFAPSAPHLDRYDDGNKMNLLFLSRFDPRNGLALMIRAFAIVKSVFPDVRLIVVGDGLLRSYYRRLVPGWLANDVHFEGLARDRRPRYYASCHVFCSPITKASFGVSLLEAMASGKPIVAIANKGYEELLGTAEGFLVANGDVAAFAQKILLLLRDESLRTEMGAQGRRKALGYSWNLVAAQIADYYAEILRGRS